MQQTLFNAFKEAQTLSSTSSSGQQQSISVNNGNNSIQSTAIVHEKSQIPVAEGIPELFSNFQNASNSTTPLVSVNNAEVSKGQQNATNTGISTSQAQQNWLAETMHIIPTLDPSSYIGQYSPTYTSQSFDDLHLFIGKECPSTSNNTAKSSTTPSHSDIIGPATDAANNIIQQDSETNNCIISSEADAYSLLAQQSVAAVSKHSAYETSTQINQGQLSETLPDNKNKQNMVQNLLHSTPSFQNSGSPQSKLNQGNQSILMSTSATHQSIKSSIGSGSGSVSPEIASGGKGVEDDASSASFNAANLQLHSAAVEERERAANAVNKELNKTRIKSENVTKIEDSSSPPSSSKFDSNTVLRHANIVSGSDRSSSDNGNESMSGGGSGSSGSDNASDNSDAVSDEGQPVGSGSRKRRGGKNYDISNSTANKDNKRQKTSSSVSSKVKQEHSSQ